MTLSELIVSPAIQRERAKARRMGSLFRQEGEIRRSGPVVLITLGEQHLYFADQPKSVPTNKPVRPVALGDIVRMVCRHYDVSPEEFWSHRRPARVSRCRQVVSFLAKTLTSRSYPDLAVRLRAADHTTILSRIRAIELSRQSDSKLDAELISFERELAAG